MRRLGYAVLWLLTAASSAIAADPPDPLAQARLLYNQRQFTAAISAAEKARLSAGAADGADLVAARAYLERYRESTASDDLTNARERLRRLNPQGFAPRERAEFIVGLGEALYFDCSYGAAADLFESALQVREVLTVDARERVLDWWATAVDRDASPRPDIERQSFYLRIRDRMRDELAARPDSATASYWSPAAARAQGDLRAAWDAAEAGWVRALLAVDRGEALRADLDRLVLRAIIPERARVLGHAADQLRLEWEQFKEQWKHD
jgi:hypothetical protein